MNIRLLIIADDLTGANDTGVQFARAGISTLVSIFPPVSIENFADQCQVLVVNTNSRHLPADEAYALVFEIAQQGVRLGIPRFYKKTDSTLRGNIGSEFAALLAATKERELFFAPAYPQLHRATERGFQLVAGQPLHQTGFASDPLNPINESFIPAIIASQTSIPVRIFDADSNNPEPAIFVMDAVNDEALRRHAFWLQDRNRTKLLAGSAGWAEFLPEIFSFDLSPRIVPKLSAPMLIVNGSLHENSLRQIACAAQHGIPVIDFQANDAAQFAVGRLDATGSAILTTNAAVIEPDTAGKLANIACKILKESHVETLIVFGGDTLAAIAEALHWKSFRPCTEFLPGVPMVEVCEQENILLVTKAGGFGKEDLLLEILKNEENS